ncbi:DUF6769 family protein [Maribellus maritimus]|uniref:DUF6769 family protein n=1 Tax=Maribellus maritimus TaxID=2870838 RepID=UPI001EEB2235|nr:DUF6769 family protein [Maribellus maritimus]MCG6189438.1 hypothetical protein [Maribellus maritimus]
MIRRATAVYHVIVVSILLLAHAVVPHIHFDDEIVITGSVEHRNIENCKHNHHKHSEEDSSEADFCLLKQVYLARSNDTESGDELQQWLKDQHDSSDVLFAILYFSKDYFFTPPTQPPIFFHLNSFYSCLGNGSINSRGSPLA